MLLVELGYVFGIIHKALYNYNWVIWMYLVLFCLVAVDLFLYWRNWRLEHRQARTA